MKVKELMVALSKCPPELEVLSEYDDGELASSYAVAITKYKNENLVLLVNGSFTDAFDRASLEEVIYANKPRDEDTMSHPRGNAYHHTPETYIIEGEL